MLFPPLLCALRENKIVRGIGPKADNIYTVGAGSLQRSCRDKNKKTIFTYFKQIKSSANVKFDDELNF